MLNFLSYLIQGKPSGNPPTLTLAQYVALASELPSPTDQQKENFANFVSGAHSWYKHIPFFLPGVRFHFFIDPSAGCKSTVTLGGRVKFTSRVESGFHYSWIPTDQYRERFGYLAYSCGAGPGAFEVKWHSIVTPGDNIAAIPKDGRLYALPPEVLRAGSVHLTSVIHTLSARNPPLGVLTARDADDLIWPAEAGGRETLQRIIERCKEIRQESSEGQQRKRMGIEKALELEDPNIASVDPELYELLAPERRRQRFKMVKAMHQACNLVHS